MKATPIHDRIRVVVRCTPGRLEPLRFTWQEREFEVTRTHACWRQNDAGETPTLHFSVQVEHDTYFLSFSLRDLVWHLEQRLGD
jgi:hypothetical protein